MDGSDSEALEQLRDLYTPVDHKTFAAANSFISFWLFLSFYKTVVISKSFTETQKPVLNVIAFSV